MYALQETCDTLDFCIDRCQLNYRLGHLGGDHDVKETKLVQCGGGTERREAKHVAGGYVLESSVALVAGT